MIDKTTYGIEHIHRLQKKYAIDPGLLERTIYAFGLLEAISMTQLPFCFKGGTSLMLITSVPERISTDIDILVEPNIEIDPYIDKASQIFPFIDKEEDIRRGRNGIQKRHFKFTYYSPIRKTNFYILLDVVFAHSPYTKTIQKEIQSPLLLPSGKNSTVTTPIPECLLADKLTAFAPHTTGIPFGKGKELEIAKQLFDVATLTTYLNDYDSFVETYHKTVKEEAAFRDKSWTSKDVLEDTLNACICIVSRGKINTSDYKELLSGIKSLKNHIFHSKYNVDWMTLKTCKVMYLVSCVISNKTYHPISNISSYLNAKLANSDYKKLSYVRKLSLEAYAYLVEASRNLSH